MPITGQLLAVSKVAKCVVLFKPETSLGKVKPQLIDCVRKGTITGHRIGA